MTDTTHTGEQTSGTAHFRISGGSLTRLARDYYRSKGATAAVRFLVDGLEGLDVSRAIDVIAGHQRLVGDEHGMELADEIPDVSREIRVAMTDVWRRRWQDLHGVWWEPYALVTSWSMEDAVFAREQWDDKCGNGAMRRVLLGHTTPAKCTVFRTLYYADDPSRDMAIWQEFPRGCVLSRPVSEPDLVAMAILGSEFVPNRAPPPDCYNLRGPTYTSPEATPETAAAAVREQQSTPVMPPDRGDADRERERERRAQRDAEARVAEVREQADRVGGWITLHVPRPAGDGRPTSYRIPRAPLERHVSRTPFEGPDPTVWPDWQPVHPSGMRLHSDSPDHTDWMSGAMPPVPFLYDNSSWRAEYDKPLTDAIWELRGRIYGRQDNARHVEHLAGPRVRAGFTGRVVHAQVDTPVPPGSVVVAPHAGTEFYIAAHSAGPTGLVIVEAGGAMAHLVIMAEADRFTVLQARDALHDYPEGTRVRVTYDAAGRPNIHVIEEAT